MKQDPGTQKERHTFRVRSDLQDNVLSLLSIVSVILGTLLVVFFMLWFLYKADILSIPLSGLFGKQGEETAEPYIEPSVIDFLKSAADGSEDPESPAVRFSGGFDTLYALLSEAIPADSYYMETETAFHSGEARTACTVRIWKDGQNFRISRYPVGDPGQAENYLSDGAVVRYSDTASSKTASFPMSDAFSIEALAGVPSVRAFTDDASVVIDSASYTESGDEVIFFVRFHHADAQSSGITEEYWISPASELVLACRTYAGNQNSDAQSLIFSDTLLAFRPLTDVEKSALAAEAGEP